ncbi:gas vesicle protein GvpJ [Streptomyces collinus]|uniref:gas vesicle protein GvpJ n=1 Tax=Streptomyces collinus TaxID=42684 RepID=UPI00367AB474
MTVARQQGGGGGSSGLYDVLELILDRGLVIDAYIRVSVIGIEILTIDVRIVIASIDTYLRFAEACNRLDLESGARKPAGLPQLADSDSKSAADSEPGADSESAVDSEPGADSESGPDSEKTKSPLAGAAEAVLDAYQQARNGSAERPGGRASRQRGE